MRPNTTLSKKQGMALIYQSFFNTLKNFILIIAKLQVSNYTLGMIGAIVIPTAIGIIGIKTYKIIFALWPVTRSTLGWEPPTLFGGMRIVLVSPLAFYIGACLAVYFFLWGRFIYRHWLNWALLFLLPLIALPLFKGLWFWLGMDREQLTGIESTWTHQVVHVYWDALTNIQFLFVMYRDDISFLIGYALFATLAVSITPNRWRRLMHSLFIGLSVIILAVAGLELAHYLKTGLNGTASMLLYFIKNAGDMWSMMGSEFNWKTIAVIAIPPSLIVLSPVFVRLTVKDVWISRQQDLTLFDAGKLVWPILLLLILVPHRIDQQKTISQEYARLRGNINLNIGLDLLFRPTDPIGTFEKGEALRQAAINLEFIPTANTRRLNVVIVMLESVRANATSVYNPSLRNTPFMNDLSKKSLVADQMYAVTPRTSSAWVSVLNGAYPGTNSALMYWSNQESKHPTFASLPRLLRKSGYQSAFFTPTHLAYENEAQLLSNIGFDKIASEKNYNGTLYEHVSEWGFEDRAMINPILSWVDSQQEANSPFLLTVMTNVGHQNYKIPSTWNRQKFTDSNNEEYSNYLNCIAYIDDFLKRLFNEFQRRGLFQNTIFFILGDHGDSFGEHGTKLRALSMYEEALHIPMIIFAPSLFSDGESIVGPRQQVDILPTIADMLGFSIRDHSLPGISLLRDNPKDREIYYGSALDEVSIGMRKGSRKYVYNFDSAPMEVFDLEQDPLEQHDLGGEISEEEAHSVKNQMLMWYGATRVSMTGSP
ncbi:LTA synthase family protein [Candidatus Methylobacter oryzae]|uniref:LTA synthase family protein n=1 Tax=Candidatus Methylobacter oryzae TaxID=2497749 RepID=A0ABY3C9L5_9GAMM|nr:LTA synthase family protein [Candidatus Methylobacter oryzae]TRW94361.1 LTA synthase family protein [Candidatus Methylobacter oryzae]